MEQLMGILLFITFIAVHGLMYVLIKLYGSNYRFLFYFILSFGALIGIKILDNKLVSENFQDYNKKLLLLQEDLNKLKTNLLILNKSDSLKSLDNQEKIYLGVTKEDLSSKIKNDKKKFLLIKELKSKSKEFVRSNATYFPWRFWLLESINIREGIYGKLE